MGLMCVAQEILSPNETSLPMKRKLLLESVSFVVTGFPRKSSSMRRNVLFLLYFQPAVLPGRNFPLLL